MPIATATGRRTWRRGSASPRCRRCTISVAPAAGDVGSRAAEEPMRTMLTFSIEPRLFARFPALSVGAMLVTQLDRAASSVMREELDAEWTAAVSELGRRGITA